MYNKNNVKIGNKAKLKNGVIATITAIRSKNGIFLCDSPEIEKYFSTSLCLNISDGVFSIGSDWDCEVILIPELYPEYFI